jgi:hydroxypyruvate isomerase
VRASVAWWCLANAGLGPDAIVRAALGAGCEGVELAGEEHWARLREAGLAIAAERGHASLEVGLNRPEEHDRIEREIVANLRLAQDWGIDTLICFSGNRHGATDEAGAEQTAAGLLRVATAAEEAGVTLALELLNSRVDHPGYQCDRTAWGAAVIDLVGSPRVKLLYDVYHMQVMEGDVIRTFRDNAARIAHVHVAGNPGRHEPDGTQELHYPAIYRAIADAGYDGWVGMEFLPAGEPTVGLAAAVGALGTGREG